MKNEESDYYSEEMKTFTPPFFNHFSLSLNRKKPVAMRAMRENLNIHASAADLLHIRIGILDWCNIEKMSDIEKMKREK